MIATMTDQKEQEWQGEARRASLIAEFQAYIHITSQELSLASDEETEALRTPLLQMKLTEEDIRAWEQFRTFLPRLLHSAQALHAEIGYLLQQATNDHLLDTNDIAAWHVFFRNTGIGFREKEQGAKELTKKLSVQRAQNTDEYPPKEHSVEPNILKKEHSVEPNILKKDQDVEQRPQKTREQESEPLSLLGSTRIHTQWLLTLLPSSITPLYTAAAKRGSFVLHAVQKTLEQSLVQQNFGLRHQKGTIILTAEKLQNTEGSLATCQASVAQGGEAPTVILEPISLPTQSVVVHGIHQALLQNLRTLEQQGTRF